MQDLAYRFKVSVSTISRIFFKWIAVMHNRLYHLILWPDRDALMKIMPACFQASFRKKVAVIIDCLEIFLERPSNLHVRALYMVIIIQVPQYHQSIIRHYPTGHDIIFIRHGGHVSDKYITQSIVEY